MLVLTRRIGEDIIINDNICVTILDINRKQARIGIEAPLEISIHRREIHDRIKMGLPPKNKKEIEATVEE